MIDKNYEIDIKPHVDKFTDKCIEETFNLITENSTDLTCLIIKNHKVSLRYVDIILAESMISVGLSLIMTADSRIGSNLSPEEHKSGRKKLLEVFTKLLTSENTPGTTDIDSSDKNNIKFKHIPKSP